MGVTFGPGWDRLRKRLAEYQENVALKWDEQQAKDIAENHLLYARQLCPVGTGKMRDSLHLTFDRREGGFERSYFASGLFTDRYVSGDRTGIDGAISVASQAYGLINTDDEHDLTFRPGTVHETTVRSTFKVARYYLTCDDPAAVFVEYGTARQPAIPFMRASYRFAREMFLARATRYSRDFAHNPF